MDTLKSPWTNPGTTRPEFLRLREVLAMIPVSKSTWWAGVRAGRYPQSVKLSARTTAWRRIDIETLVSHLGQQCDATVEC